jgi:two-component system, cell cycle sensor histidine kinase and response regulator CckA
VNEKEKIRQCPVQGVSMTNGNDNQGENYHQTDLEIENEKLRRTIEKMQDFQNCYEELYDFAPVGYVTIDEQGIILDSNHTFANLMGTSENSLINGTLVGFILADDQPDYDLFQNKLFETGKETVGEIRIYASKHVSVWVSMKGKISRDKKSGKSVARIMVSDINKYKQTEGELKKSQEKYRSLVDQSMEMPLVRDITLSKQAESAIQESHQSILTILNNIDAIIHVIDMNSYDVLFINQYTRNNFGVGEGQKCWSALQSNQTGPCDFCTNEKLVDADGNPTGVYRWEFNNTKTEKWYECHDSAIKWIDGRLVRMEIAIDITDRKKAEQALKDSEEKHRRLFETMSQGVIYQDAAGAIISANPAAERILGLSLDQMLGKTSMDPRWKMIREDGSHVPGTQHPAMQALQTGQKVGPVTRGVLHRDKNTHVWLSITAIPLFQPGDTIPFQAYATFENITEQKQAEEKVKHLNEVLLAIRNVNQLITQEKDRDQLLHKSCQNLVETRGYHNAWICLLDSQNKASAFYSAGLGDKALILKEQLEKELPLNCLETILEGENVLVVDDPYSQCASCLLKTRYKFRAGLSGRLEYQGRFFGILTVSTPVKMAHDKEELELFEELVGDISFALHKLEREEERKQHLENLRMYELIISTVKEQMSIVDSNYVYRTVNQAYLDKYSKKTKDEIVGHTVENLLGSKVFHELVKPRLDRCLNGEEVLYEEWFDTPFGEKMCRAMHYYPYWDQKGDIRGVVVNSRDITDQKRMETAIKESHQRVLTILNNINASVYVSDIDSHDVLFVNRYVKNKLGDIEGEKCWRTLQSDQSGPCDFCTNKKLVDAEGNPTGINRWEFQKTKTGKWYDCHDSAIKWIDGRLVRMEIAIDITERKRAEQALKQSESAVRKKLQAIIEPEGDLGILKLSDLVDYHSIQSMMEDFFRVTNIGSSVIDLSGNILVGVGWQDVCTKFHRTHPETNQKCKESDVILSAGIRAGTFRAYQCKNNMWDMATPIEIDGRHLGNIFLGQFFYENEVPDYELFRNQARRYGFNEAEYLAAIDRVPRWSHETVEAVMSFYAKLGEMLSSLNYSKIKLSRALAQQKSTLIQLSESENKYRTLVENANDIIYTLTSDGIFTYVSPNWTQLLGHEISEVEGHSFMPFVHRDDVSDCSEFLRKVFESGEKQSGVEYRVLHKNGQWRWHTSNASAKRDKDGHVTEYMGIARDISYRKQAEEALKANYHLLGIAGKTAKFGGWSVTLAENKIFWSDEVAAIHDMPSGYCPSVKEGISFYASEWQDKITEVFNDCAEKGVSYDEEMEIITAAGKRVWVRAIGEAVRDKNGKILKVQGSFQDITESKQAEEALKKREFLLNKIFDLLPMGLWLVDKNGKLLSGNPAGIKIWGAQPTVSLEEYGVFKARRLPSRQEIIPEDWALAHTIKKGITVKDELLEIDAFDGKKKIILNYTAPVLDDNGQLLGAIVMNQDVTGQKLAEEEKEKLQAQFIQAQKMESIGRLAGGVAHDINNKILVILGYAELIRESLEKSDPNHEFIEEIIDAGQKGANIVGQLLAFARKQIISPKVCELNKIVESMLKMIRRLIGEDINLVWMPSANICPVKIDPAQIDQILANLCVNARDAITGVGKITIETENVTLEEEYCSRNAGFLPGEYVMLAVSDNGEGMDKETLDNIFEPFFTTKPVGVGTGLGLATVYGIVQQNQGFINVYSEPGEGTTIKVYIPRHVVKVRKIQTESAVEIPKGHGETVLLVEDEKPILKMSKLMLEKLGYKVLSAGTPSEAICLAEEHSGAIDLLITDVIMPGMNGRELSDQLNDLYPNIKTLFISGYTANVIAHHGVLDKDVSFIQKPFSKKELAVKIRKVLNHDEFKSQ